MNANFVIKRGK